MKNSVDSKLRVHLASLQPVPLCMYCGAALATEEEVAAKDSSTAARRNAVDEKFLSDEVETSQAEEGQAVKDAFLQRLRRM